MIHQTDAKTNPPALARAGSPVPARARGSGLLLAVLLLGQFMCILDVFVVNVAMPSIGTELRASGAELQLIVGGYTIAYAMLLITGARLGDRYGRRRVFLTGIIAFTAASLACAVAPDIAALIAARFVQGAGAAMLVPQIFSLIQLRFSGQARARALSAYAAVLSSGAVAGLVLGGVIVSADLLGQEWRPIFAINVPVGIVLVALTPRILPADATAGPVRKLDIKGLAAAAASVLLLVVPLVLGQQKGWPAWAYCSLAAGAALAVLFVRIERQIARCGADPLLNLDVLRSPGLPSGLTTLVLTQVGYGGLLFTFTLYLQAGLGESALRAALSYLPMSVTFGLAGYCWRRLPAVLHSDLPAAGLALSAMGYLALAVAVRHGQQAPLSAYLAQAGIGAGLGMSVSPLLTQSLARVHQGRIADASGLLTTSVQLGQLTGIAALGSVYLALRRQGAQTAHPAAATHAANHGATAATHAANAAAYAATHAAMSTTSCCLAALSLAGLIAALTARRAGHSQRRRLSRQGQGDRLPSGCRPVRRVRGALRDGRRPRPVRLAGFTLAHVLQGDIEELDVAVWQGG
jgi:MFS family permease